MEYFAIALCVLLFVVILYHFGLFDSSEHAALSAPNFRASLVDVDRARQKDPRGLSVTDYVLEANLLQDLPLSEQIRIL